MSYYNTDDDLGEFSAAVKRLTEIDGVGETRAEEIAGQLSDRGIGVVDLLELDDMTEINGIGPTTAKNVRAEFLGDNL